MIFRKSGQLLGYADDIDIITIKTYIRLKAEAKRIRFAVNTLKTRQEALETTMQASRNEFGTTVTKSKW